MCLCVCVCECFGVVVFAKPSLYRFHVQHRGHVQQCFRPSLCVCFQNTITYPSQGSASQVGSRMKDHQARFGGTGIDGRVTRLFPPPPSPPSPCKLKVKHHTDDDNNGDDDDGDDDDADDEDGGPSRRLNREPACSVGSE